jgi:succinyldiaminopimelate transaminase
VLLPDFPWDSLAQARRIAQRHPTGIVDLSVGTPVDPTPDIVTEALAGAADAPGYPTTQGTGALRESIRDWLARARSVQLETTAILPVLGTKELVAWLPTLLGVGRGAMVGYPELAYPTYQIGALISGATPVAADSTVSWGPSAPSLLWLNSPANPNGRVLGIEHLAKVVAWARARGTVVVSDECYAGLSWQGPDPSLLDPQVCGGDHSGLLVVHSLSKRSNMAGYRFGFVGGDPELVGQLLEVRKHAGMMVPAPVQAAAAAAYGDDLHAQAQRGRYRRRREVLLAGLAAGEFRVDESEGGLYLWVTEGRPCRETVDRLAGAGILVAPGDFYGPAGAEHVRIALTASDDQVELAASRFAAMGER